MAEASTRVDPGELWETHNALKSRCWSSSAAASAANAAAATKSESAVEAARNALDPNALTIGFARRFATYKRADLFLRKLDEMADLINDSKRPVQFIFAGKAHPADEPGKKLIQKIANLRHDPRFAGRIVFIEDYDINVARHMVQGRRRVAQQPAPSAGSLRHQRHEGGAQRRAQLFDPRRLVGRSLQRQERLRHRQRHAACRTTRSPTPATPTS